MLSPAQEIARALSLPMARVEAALGLLDQGDTLPFIARYRKEATGGLDEVEIGKVDDLRLAIAAREARREAVRSALESTGKLTPEVALRLAGAADLQAIEDLYEPLKEKRRTRGEIAREAGLEPLADRIALGEKGTLAELARRAIADGAKVATSDEALAGAADILAERVGTDADLRAKARADALGRGRFAVAYRKDGKEADPQGTYRDLDGYARPVPQVPPDRVLAALRGEREKALRASIELEDESHRAALERRLVGSIARSAEARTFLAAVAADAWERLLWPRVQVDVRRHLRETAEAASIERFAQNTEELLGAPPLGAVAVLGIDPGYRTGCKLACVDATGRFLEGATIYPTPPRSDLAGSAREVIRLCKAHGIAAIACGRGTGGRETAAFLRDLAKAEPSLGLSVHLVNEAGASIYSASEAAREEFPDLDLTVRGAISIARRLQDPLAELVKIDPKSIGVGQYQHDVDQAELARALERTVERVVNRVGAELNTASACLLAQVSGLGPVLAKRIVAHRDEHGAYPRRKALLDVSGVGPRTFELAAGFLRIAKGTDPLDRTAIHPESYPLVERLAAAVGCPVAELVGDTRRLAGLDPARFVDERYGLPTVQDVLAELRRGGADVRGAIEKVEFDDGVRELTDLKVGLQLNGVVTNVARFGAFVDIGVGKDALIHISKLAKRFVQDPGDVVKVGERVRVRVLEVDLERGRVALERIDG